MNAADLAVLNLRHLRSRCRDTGMSDIRFINKNGTGVDIATVRKRFFEAAADAEINPLYANRMWHDALHGDADARRHQGRLPETQTARFFYHTRRRQSQLRSNGRTPPTGLR